MMSTSGRGPLNAAWDITPEMLAGNHTVVLAVGVTLAPFGAPAPTTMTQEWYECISYARVVGDGIEILSPCDGLTHYQFPNGQTALSHEDVSRVLDVRLSQAHAGRRGRIRS
jgi:hypothetical protein